MRFSFFSFCLALSGLLVFASCNKEEIELTDDQLIEAITNANKTAITFEELPSVSKNEMDANYTESAVETTQLAAELGYQVNTRRDRGSELGKAGQVFFALDGRKLLKGKDKDCDKDDRKCYDKDKEYGDLKECFDLVYPATLIMPDGSTVTGANGEELWDNVKAWYEANPNSTKKDPVLQYPIDIEFTDGSIMTISTKEDLKVAYSRCPDRDGEDVDRDDCFKFGYPLSYTMPDGTTITGADDRELWGGIKSWYEANPNEAAEPVLQYPADITYLDGTTATVSSDEDLRAAYANCEE